jgi:hypothetical protein
VLGVAPSLAASAAGDALRVLVARPLLDRLASVLAGVLGEGVWEPQRFDAGENVRMAGGAVRSGAVGEERGATPAALLLCRSSSAMCDLASARVQA